MEAVFQGPRLSSRGSRARGWGSKAITALLGIGIAVAAALVFLVAINAIEASALVPNELWREALLGFADQPDIYARGIVAAVAGLVAISALYITVRGLVGSSRSAEPSRASLILSADDLGVVAVDTDSICTLAETAILRGARVLDARVQLRGRGNAPVNLKINVLVHDGANLTVVGNEVRNHAQRAIEKLAGLEVANAAVSIEVAEANRIGRALL